MSELARLIEEQAKDAATFRVHSISLDAFPSGVDAPGAKQLANDGRHGSLYYYVRLRCRCVKCRAGNAAYKREWKRRTKARQRHEGFVTEAAA